MVALMLLPLMGVANLSASDLAITPDTTERISKLDSLISTTIAEAPVSEDTLRARMAETPPISSIHNNELTKLPNTIPHPDSVEVRLSQPKERELIDLQSVIESLKEDMPEDEEVREALEVIIQYVEDKQLQEDISAMQENVSKTEERLEALEVIQQQVTEDSLRYGDDYLAYNDLQLLLEGIRQDSAFAWLERISRDSMELEVVDLDDETALKLWLNSPTRQFHRIWLETTSGDTIGAWLESIPGGNKLRINIDPIIDHREMEHHPDPLDMRLRNDLDVNKFKVSDINTGEFEKRYWTYYTSYDLSLSQSAVVNWASGGENSVALLFKWGGFVDYSKDKVSWESYALCNLGVVWYEGEHIRKSDDYFELNTKLGYQARKHWYYTVQFNMQTQFFKSYTYSGKSSTLIGNFLSPGYFTPSLGMNYKPNGKISLMLAPLAGKVTFVRCLKKVDPTRYGVKENSHAKSEIGASITYNHIFNNIWNFLDISSYMDLFLYYSWDSYKVPLYADWKLDFKFNINYLLSATLYAEGMYNEDYSRKMQFKENLGLTITFRL